MKTTHLRTLLAAIIFTTLLFACESSKQLPPAPLDSTSGLESLASAYTSTAKNFPIAPTSMNAKAQKAFLVDVFIKANFSYSKTLQSFERYTSVKHSKNIKDLAELLALPHKNISTQSQIDLYTEQELKGINQIDKILN